MSETPRYPQVNIYYWNESYIHFLFLGRLVVGASINPVAYTTIVYLCLITANLQLEIEDHKGRWNLDHFEANAL